MAMRPSIALKNKRAEVLEIISRYSVANPRVFGSVLHGTDKEGSDLDILVDALPGTGLGLFKLQGELEDALGVQVEVSTPGCLHRFFRSKVIAEAVPL
jgi:uncharacterized protein